MAPSISIGLVHYPVRDREGRIITTAVTNMDLHDLGRLACTYDLDVCYIIQPLELQRRLVERLIRHWLTGPGASYNLTRKQAFERLQLVKSVEEARASVSARTGITSTVVATTARRRPGQISYSALRRRLEEGGSWLILFGTGWGLDPDFMNSQCDLILEPIAAAAPYNHLSVRTAAAIIIDRLLGER